MLATILNVTIAMQFLLMTCFKYFRGVHANVRRDAKISKSLALALLINWALAPTKGANMAIRHNTNHILLGQVTILCTYIHM